MTMTLSPCPWCGTTEHLSYQWPGSMTADMPDRPCRVVCTHIDHDTVVGPTAYGKVAAITAWNQRHRQSSSNAGGVWLDADALIDLLDDIEDEWIDHYLRPDSAERAKCKWCGGDDFFKSSIEHKPGCLAGRIRAALASLSTPTAEPMAELQRLGQEYDGDDKTEGPFHVSRSSDGEKHWFSARDPAAGVTIPAKDRNDAYALVASLNRSCTVFARRALATPPTPDRIGKDAVREALANDNEWVCAGIPDDAIEAGIEAWQAANHEMTARDLSANPEDMTDWDEGMIVCAIFKAVGRALSATPPAQEGEGWALVHCSHCDELPQEDKS